MQLGALGHLTYCTNVHPGERLDEVHRNLAGHVAAVKALVSPAQPFGVGLWLSAAAAHELGAPGALAALRTSLEQHGLYVFTLNAFPYGAFHGGPVKQRVYEPDWRDPRRLAYSNRLAELLAELLPEGVQGSMSTLPLGYKANLRAADDPRAMADQLIAHAAHLHALEQHTGKHIALALEPEPLCALETGDEAIAFFERELRGRTALERMRALTGAGPEAAAALITRHLGLCLDACHAAVEYEDARELVQKLRAAGVPVWKLQLSSGLRVERMDAASASALGRYADPVYLHQVIERSRGELRRYADLPEALSAFAARGEARAEPSEWRVHFHVPVFLERMQSCGSTQAFLRELLALHRVQPIAPHLEVETYTWEVLPDEARNMGLSESLARELRFCLGELGCG